MGLTTAPLMRCLCSVILRFDPPFWGRGLRSSAFHAHWKARRRSGVPISDNWTFFASFYGWRATSEHRLKNAVLEVGGSLWWKTLGRRRHPPSTICAQLDRSVNALQLCRWKFSHKETLQQTFFERSTLLQQKNDQFVLYLSNPKASYCDRC